MKFFVEPPAGEVSVLDMPAAFQSMEELVRRCVEAAHNLEIAEIDRIEQTQWWAFLRATDQRAIEDVRAHALAAAWTNSRRPPQKISDAATARAARDLAMLPLVVLVESSLRDGGALEAAVLLLGKPALVELIEAQPVPPVVSFQHCGGVGDMPKLAQQAANRFTSLGGSVRVLVVLDSDDAIVGHTSPQVATTVTSITSLAPDAAVHVHKQRCIENYLPRAYWETVKVRIPHHAGLQTLLQATNSQWDSFDFATHNLKKIPSQGANTRTYHAAAFAEEVRVLPPESREAWSTSIRAGDRHGDLQSLVALIDSLR